MMDAVKQSTSTPAGGAAPAAAAGTPAANTNSAANVVSPSRAALNSVRNAESPRCSATANHERTRMGCRSLRMLVAVAAGHGCLGRSIQQHHPGDEASTSWRNAVASVPGYGRDHRRLPSRGVASRLSHLSRARLALPQSFLLRAAAPRGISKLFCDNSLMRHSVSVRRLQRPYESKMKQVASD